MDNKLDLNLLKTFVAIYHHRSITTTADALEMSQPAISKMLKRLQEQLGFQLFVRQGKGMLPTQYADELAKQVLPALSQIQNAIGNLESFTPKSYRKFVIYVPEHLLVLLLPKIENDPELEYVDIELRTMLHNFDSQLNVLYSQQADLIIDYTNHSAPSFFTETLHSDFPCIVVSRNHPRIKYLVSKEDYYSEYHIALKLRRENQYLADYFTEEPIEDRNIGVECDSIITQLLLVSSSEHIAVVTERIALNFSDLFGLNVLKLPFSPIPIVYHMLAHKRERNNLANQWLREKIKSYLR
ncbi:LysR family transcriptional regulator [Vibrio fluvialis]|nr:LysR family transcriptional regulator [Vibrio fluvialis]